MELDDHARRMLRHLATAKGSFLFGKRQSEAALTLIDNAAKAEKRVVPDSLRFIDRRAVEQLLAADYICDNSGTNDSANISYRITEKGLQLFPR